MFHSEDEIQKGIASYLKGLETHTQKKFTFFHVPNGGKRGKREASKLKAMGVRAGVPDLVIFFNAIISNPVFIELKAGKGKISDNQSKYIKILKELNYDVYVVKVNTIQDGVTRVAQIMEKHGVSV